MRSRWLHVSLLAALLAAASCASSGGATPPAAPRCSTDADCRLYSSYCDGCACRALDKTAADPTCGGATVQCLIDPCQRQRAVCAAGACALAPPQ